MCVFFFGKIGAFLLKVVILSELLALTHWTHHQKALEIKNTWLRKVLIPFTYKLKKKKNKKIPKNFSLPLWNQFSRQTFSFNSISKGVHRLAKLLSGEKKSNSECKKIRFGRKAYWKKLWSKLIELWWSQKVLIC